MDHRRCTCCRNVQAVNLTAAFRTQKRASLSHEDASLLQSNLEQYGWSLIHIDKTVLDTSGWKHELLKHVFASQTTSFSTEQHAFTYRSNESGGTGKELKQSWEVGFKDVVEAPLPRNSGDIDKTAAVDRKQIQNTMVKYYEILFSVAQEVRKNLQLPPNLLLEERISRPRLDLLRAFHYEAAVTAEDEPVALGSSPHTDWGSWTVIWQDGVGGLQTYCRQCDKWTDVVPTSDTVIVHCSDITSIAMSEKTGDDLWPSPIHQVVLSPTDRRVSLVYFGYPPQELSLKQICVQLAEAPEAKTLKARGDSIRLPAERYDDYSLLQNQSLISSEDCRSSSQDQYEAICTTPLYQVLRDKWEQVQRG